MRVRSFIDLAPGILGALLLPLLLVSARPCPAAQAVGGVRIIDRSVDQGLELSVVNSNLAAITLTITVKPDNVRADHPMPMIVSIPGPGTHPLTLLRPVNPDADYGYRVRYDWQFGQRDVVPDTNHVYRLPFASGKQFTVVQGFHGSFTHVDNDEFAVDFAMPEGTPVLAARDGVVEVVVDRFDKGGLNPDFRDKVNLILVRQSDGTYAEYVHFRRKGARVKPGQSVKAGDVLGQSGNTGYTQGPHLHFAVFRTIDGQRRETIPMRFRTRENPSAEPVEGSIYTAP
ncbi:MAG: M23 family metallopeptidase [Verrucomicrobiales bacterium]|nr:M23 family metallopeptidase [Verrucomicrobiales bacterium]